MRRMRFSAIALILTLLGVRLAPRHDAQAPTIRVDAVSYDELGERIRGLEGRVIVVDFWADYCLPCKKEFPRLVALNRKYSSLGLTTISVSLDDPADDEAQARVRRFLTVQKANFANYVLKDTPEVWRAKLKIDGPPCLFVFHRRGQLVKKYHDRVDHDEVERIVAGLFE